MAPSRRRSAGAGAAVSPWLTVPALAIALIVCYAPVLGGMIDQWLHDEDMGHGLVVPFVILWVIWRERARWMALPVKPSWWGFGLLAAAAVAHLLSVSGAGLFAGAAGFELSMAGAVLCLGGFAFLRIWTFPFLLGLFMLPKLAIVYNQVTLPLQLIASRLAELLLLAGGASVSREGTILNVAGHRIAVVEACSGMRYLLTLGFMAVLFAYLFDSRPWMRVALLASAVPVAIFANALRVSAVALLPALDAGAPHAISGWLVFVLCLAMIVFVHRVLLAARARYHA